MRTMDGLVIRAATPEDQPVVHAMNDAAVPHVNALTPEQFAWLSSHADYYRVAERDGTVVGFVMAIRRGTTYWSRNYAWFTERFPDFFYLDRVVIAPEARRGGVGRALYADLAAFAATTWPRVTLEVNIDPPNPGSMAFHETLGFRRVGTRADESGAVALFELPL
jgi:predicted GNAT superfamily acetyltransferase